MQPSFNPDVYLSKSLPTAPEDQQIPMPPSSNVEAMVRSCELKLKSAKRELKRITAPYDAALQLLEMSTDATIGIDQADYHKLLGETDRSVDWDDDDNEDDS